MTINHLNLVVVKLPEAVSFFETYLDFHCETRKGDVIAVLTNKANFTLVLMTDKNDDTRYPGAFHLGFILDDTAAVDVLYERLRSGNIAVDRPPAKIRNSYGFYFYFDNLFIEIGHYYAHTTTNE
ncbi:VOC family protein [Chitinophaga pinensis]|uniref:Glyoxalase/bleomycin resistance protein/dioxygenase n=1 Tax=Chitinophaga pinensis (strain ATCC 43595 / DSM 2588 / LMG 13176 / NBRC 15968 / NCIMB 11800 / UQM 2034) TaxID=485918 RepID=A0A979G4W6_CHIPD|nr:VOC family protein [Chitinophaga pinensis]ACU60722.1 Glyoxalase/bleomycin resistance protein/dioxygenase [Chitinophaga pinensis DSM 2588]